MTPAELALHHQRLGQRMAQLRDQIQRLRERIAVDPETERLERAYRTAESSRRELEARLRRQELEVQQQRSRLRAREGELMSGRIRNPTDLMKLNQEVEHLKTAVAAEEDAQLELMEEEERLAAEMGRLGRELAAARDRGAAAAPDLRRHLGDLERELSEAEEEAVRTWSSIPPEWQEAYRQVQRRYPDPVAGVAGGHCQACRVAVTSSGMQVLRRAGLQLCDGCGRILVVR
ncbi:MAG TPA: hypothetical protein VFD49_17365 [Candidatus Dormibacteraeota bacterium]|nr:hypothetical protein [Candidatus Dormibacteraeota bacterium]